MTDREVMQQALEALESLFNWQVDHERGKRCGDAVVALRAQLEQPKGLFIDMIAAQGPTFVEQVRRVGENIEQQAEPVAQYSDIVSDGGMDPRNKYDTTTPQRKPLTEIELDAEFNRGYKEGARDAYARSPQRKPLTTDERGSIVNEALRGHASTRDAIDWAIRHVERHHGIGEKP